MNNKHIVTIITFAGLFFAINVSALVPSPKSPGLLVEAFNMEGTVILSSSPQSGSKVGGFSVGVPPFTAPNFSKFAAEATGNELKFTGVQWSGFIKTEMKGTHSFTFRASDAPAGANCLAKITINNEPQPSNKFSTREKSITFSINLQVGETPISIWLNCSSDSSEINLENVQLALLKRAPRQENFAPIAKDKYFH